MPTPAPPPSPAHRPSPRPSPPRVRYPRYHPVSHAPPRHDSPSPLTFTLLIVVPAVFAIAVLRPR
ncbi:hypothetical protein NGF19_29700 [Streptomyces sp. RY43-2]|uniref:Proline-rich protein n=1 Tax=Streptomyces macrolidinus TaxID=2952607 RepID=A0ABT0ZMT5_9ACTN|nr:hypothetical protein [Streptomyces macrolidinus]MCN9244908.1 hypothetical protein [Streptomyces macrolidinus]